MKSPLTHTVILEIDDYGFDRLRCEGASCNNSFVARKYLMGEETWEQRKAEFTYAHPFDELIDLRPHKRRDLTNYHNKLSLP